VRVNETRCPFCATRVEGLVAVPAPSPSVTARMSRSARVALGAALAMTLPGCGGGSEPKSPDPSAAPTASGAQPNEPPDDGTPAAEYGAPAPPDDGKGAPDQGGGAPEYGAPPHK